MRTLFHYSFLIPLLLFLIHQFLQKGLAINIDLLNFYLDPFCFGAMVPSILLWERKLLFKQSHFSTLELLIITVSLIIISEVLLPALSQNFVTDLRDVFLIFAGVFWFRAFHPSYNKQN